MEQHLTSLFDFFAVLDINFACCCYFIEILVELKTCVFFFVVFVLFPFRHLIENLVQI